MTAPTALRPQQPMQRPLSELVQHFNFTLRGNATDRLISGTSLSSRTVEPGDLYVGVPGRNAHGAQYAADALERGASAVLTDAHGASLITSDIPVIVVDDARAVLGDVAAWIHRTGRFEDDHDATYFAVTGTNGKTSVVYLLDAILRQLGVVAGLSSTAERRIGEEVVTSSLTTPEASELHALLARMREQRVTAVGIEVSAQALSRHRVDGLVFDVVGFTNLSHDHLDDYTDLDKYFEAKCELFDTSRSRRAVVTVDSVWGERLVAAATVPVTTLSNLPDRAADWQMTVLEETAAHTAFRLVGPDDVVIETAVPLIGWYMAANAALAIVMLVDAGFAVDRIAEVLSRDGGINAYVPGRVERISGTRGPAVYVDYGHTPDAFLHTLASVRRTTTGKVVMVFGADGDRDCSKRAEMGAIAARGADLVVVTDFHPRSEDPAAIRRALIDGASAAVPDREILEIADPKKAIRAALARAAEGDAIVYAGPGHEDYREVAGERIAYSARSDSREAIREAGWLE